MNPTSASVLDSLRIASPCTADWAAMTGDDKKRFCAQCKLHVHDLSAMTSDEAMAFLRGAGEGRVCVRFHRRTDGRVLTRDCPVGLRRRLRQAWLRAAALVAALWTNAACTRTGAVAGNGAPTPTMGRSAMGEAVMGDVAAPPQPQQAQPQQAQPQQAQPQQAQPQQAQPQQAQPEQAQPQQGTPQVEVLQGKVRRPLPEQPPRK